jgi:hypothetical protein
MSIALYSPVESYCGCGSRSFFSTPVALTAVRAVLRQMVARSRHSGEVGQNGRIRPKPVIAILGNVVQPRRKSPSPNHTLKTPSGVCISLCGTCNLTSLSFFLTVVPTFERPPYSMTTEDKICPKRGQCRYGD